MREMKVCELMIDDWVLDKKTNLPYKIIGTNDLLFHNDYSPFHLPLKSLRRMGGGRLDVEPTWMNKSVYLRIIMISGKYLMAILMITQTSQTFDMSTNCNTHCECVELIRRLNYETN